MKRERPKQNMNIIKIRKENFFLKFKMDQIKGNIYHSNKYKLRINNTQIT
jgi:hypothetical protein